MSFFSKYDHTNSYIICIYLHLYTSLFSCFLFFQIDCGSRGKKITDINKTWREEGKKSMQKNSSERRKEKKERKYSERQRRNSALHLSSLSQMNAPATSPSGRTVNRMNRENTSTKKVFFFTPFFFEPRLLRFYGSLFLLLYPQALYASSAAILCFSCPSVSSLYSIYWPFVLATMSSTLAPVLNPEARGFRSQWEPKKCLGRTLWGWL